MNKFKFIFTLLLFVVCCGALKTASAQTTPPTQNYSNVNIDNYTDQQIRQMLQEGQAKGYTDAELLQQLQNGGMSQANITKLTARIRDIRGKEQVINSGTDTTSAQGRKLNFTSATDTTFQKDPFADLKPRIFGADIFKGKASPVASNLNIATPLNYIVGPRDQLIINMYGNSVANWQPTVTPDGNITIPNVGIVNVGGKTIENVRSIIAERLSKYYTIGHGTNVSVTLGNIRSIQVTVVGSVVKPTTYTLSSLSTVFDVLFMAGGPTESGSLRQIHVIRDGRDIRTLDVYDLLTKGSQKDNITLQDHDIVRVPTYKTRVELTGQVKIPALFEVLPGETLQDVLNFAGGFTDSAYTARIVVSQVRDQQRHLEDIVEADYKNYIPLRGDKFFVRPVINRIENRVTINGAVFRPGSYALDKGLTLQQLITTKGAGIKEDAFTERGTITRLKPDNSKEILSFNVLDAINGKTTTALQREDVVNIYSRFDLHDLYTVTINGSVRHPQTVAYADSMSVEDLIMKAGGFAEGASPRHIEVARRVNDADPHSKNSKIATVFTVDVDNQLKLNGVNFALKPYDIVSVYMLPGFEKQKTVRVEGEVVINGNFTIENKNERISDLIARAGGLTASADAEGASLKRDNNAILGIDKSKTDTIALARERADQLNRLKRNYAKDSTANKADKDTIPRNNYVGIDLPAIMRSPGSNIDLLLEDGDVIRVPKQQQVVRVNGEVLYPSAVVYEDQKSFKEYVLNAGGFSPNALKRGAYVVYPNGTVKGTRKFLFFNSHPRVRPGSEIYVPKKPEDRSNTLPTILAFTTGLASLGAIILGILSLNK